MKPLILITIGLVLVVLPAIEEAVVKAPQNELGWFVVAIWALATGIGVCITDWRRIEP